MTLWRKVGTLFRASAHEPLEQLVDANALRIMEQELRDNVWLTCAADEILLFGDDHDHKWSQALAKLGVDPGLLSAAAGQA